MKFEKKLPLQHNFITKESRYENKFAFKRNDNIRGEMLNL